MIIINYFILINFLKLLNFDFLHYHFILEHFKKFYYNPSYQKSNNNANF